MLNRPKSNTCIIALKNSRGKILIGADRRASWDFSQAQTMTQPKVVKRNGLVLAGTGDSFLCDLICKVMIIPPWPVDMDTQQYMHDLFFRKVKSLLDQKGFVDEHKILRIPPDVSVEIVLACSGQLFSMHVANHDPYAEHQTGLITIDETAIPYATGCGGQFAWGCLDGLITEAPHLTTKDKIKRALLTAAKYSPGCDAVFDIEQED